MDSTREVAYCKTQLLTNMEIHQNTATAQFGGEIDVRTQLKQLFLIGFRDEFRES